MRRRSALALLVTAALACGGKVVGDNTGDGGGADAMMGSTIDSGGASASSSSGGNDGNLVNESGSGESVDAGVGDDGSGGDGLAPSVDAVAPVTRMLTGVGSRSSGAVSDSTWVEACSDGSKYTVSRECPTAVCCCDGINCPPYLGSGDGGVPFPYCNVLGWRGDAGATAAWAACGYPQPNWNLSVVQRPDVARGKRSRAARKWGV